MLVENMNKLHPDPLPVLHRMIKKIVLIMKTYDLRTEEFLRFC